MTSLRYTAGALFLILLLSSFGFARGDSELTQFGHDIRVEPGQKAGDVTCVDCSVHIRGQVTGDVTTIHGNIVVESGAAVSGDVTSVWGNVRTENGAQVAGDLTAVAGMALRQPQSSVAGDVTSLEGVKWLFAIILPPLLLVGLVVALVIWAVRRSRRPLPVAAGVGVR
ncbi:MAG TPA: polymer-forming cytoskeletal protein [Terriglobales bacterium]|jgi:hypothetical protein